MAAGCLLRWETPVPYKFLEQSPALTVNIVVKNNKVRKAASGSKSEFTKGNIAGIQNAGVGRLRQRRRPGGILDTRSYWVRMAGRRLKAGTGSGSRRRPR